MTLHNTHEFVCFTDDKRGLYPEIHTIDLKQIGVYGWWYKSCSLNKNLPLNGNILYFDLDIVICKNIDNPLLTILIYFASVETLTEVPDTIGIE